MEWFHAFVLTLLLVVLSTVTPLIIENGNKKSDFEAFCDGFLRNFHLNNASTFIGYTVFDANNKYIIPYVFSLIIYLLEIYFKPSLKNREQSKCIVILQLVALVCGIVGQGYCAYIILSE